MVSYKNMEQELEILLKTKARKYVEDRFPTLLLLRRTRLLMIGDEGKERQAISR